MSLSKMRFKTIEFDDKGWRVDDDGKMYFRSKFTSDNPDMIGDIITKNATERAAKEWRKWGNIRFQHDPNRPVGRMLRIGSEDDLEWNEMEGLISDEGVKQLVKDGVIRAMSVGIIPLDFEIIEEEDVDYTISPLAKESFWPAIQINDYLMVEVSLVDHPMNYDAVFSGGKGIYKLLNDNEEVSTIHKRLDDQMKALGLNKGTPSFQNLPFAPDETSWTASEAKKRVAQWASSDGSGDKDKIDWQRYRKAFFWFDPDDQENFGGYKLPFADVFDGSLKAVWRGVTAAAGVMQGARGGVDIPESDAGSVKNHIARYYKKHGDTPPWEEESMEEELITKDTEEVLEEPREEVLEPETAEVEPEELEGEPEEQEVVEAGVSEPEVEEPEITLKDVQDNVLALMTMLSEYTERSLGLLESLIPKSVDEEEDEGGEPEVEKNLSLSEEEIEKLIQERVEQAVAEMQRALPRKASVPTEEEDDPDLTNMSQSELGAELRRRIERAAPKYL